MPVNPRISLVHATLLCIPTITESFARLWPEARLFNLLEDSLTVDLKAKGGDLSLMEGRIARLAGYAVDSGADGVLFTCSAFGPAIERARDGLPIPVLKPDEAMIEDAVRRGTTIGLIASFEPAIAAAVAEFSRFAEATGKRLDVRPYFANGAWEAAQGGNQEMHDRLIADACVKASGCDVLCFAQFSMTSARDLAERAAARTVLTTPDSAVRKLKSLIAT